MSTARSSRGKALGISTHTAGGVNPDVECMSHGHVSVEYDAARQHAKAAVPTWPFFAQFLIE